MPALTVTPLPQLRDNYAYLVACPETGEAAVVDPAEADAVAEAVERAGVRLVAVWNTHHHWDHTAANLELAARQPGLAVVGFAGDSGRLPGLTHPVEAGDHVTVGRGRARVLHNPGHTTGAISYLLEDPLAVFTGDTLFGAGCGRLFEGTAADMARSLRDVLGHLPSETLVYCGHEYTAANLRFAREVDPDNPMVALRAERVAQQRAAGRPSVPSTLAEEWATNPFLRTDTAGVLATVRAHADVDPGDTAAVLGVLRRLKDEFRG